MTDDHLSLDELAELDEGLLTPERTSAARAHLAGCEQCRAGAGAITTTRSLLAGLPPEPMPADVKAQIDRALADASPQAHNVVPQLDTYRRRRFGRPTMAASAAAAAFVLVLGAIVVGAVHSNNNHSDQEDAGAAAGSALTPSRAQAQPKNYTRTSTGLTYTPSRLLADIPGLVARAPNQNNATNGFDASSAPTNSTITPNALANQPVPAPLQAFYHSRSKLLACAAAISNPPNERPIAIDFGRWTNGTVKRAPSIIFVFRDANPQVVDVYVTGPTCSGDTQVRTFQKVPLN